MFVITIKDNFLDTEKFENICTSFNPKVVPWSYQEVVHETESLVPDIDNFQFSYTIFPDTTFYGCLIPLFDKMDMDVHFRVKINLNPKAHKVFEHGYHIDIPTPSKTAIFYLNTNDGYTAFETGEKVESVANRLVVFDSHIKHTGTTCTNQKARLVLNINYKSKSDADYISL